MALEANTEVEGTLLQKWTLVDQHQVMGGGSTHSKEASQGRRGRGKERHDLDRRQPGRGNAKWPGPCRFLSSMFRDGNHSTVQSN